MERIQLNREQFERLVCAWRDDATDPNAVKYADLAPQRTDDLPQLLPGLDEQGFGVARHRCGDGKGHAGSGPRTPSAGARGIRHGSQDLRPDDALHVAPFRAP